VITAALCLHLLLLDGIWLDNNAAFLSYISSRNNSVLSFSVGSMSLPGSAPQYPQVSHAQAAFSNDDLLRGG